MGLFDSIGSVFGGAQDVLGKIPGVSQSMDFLGLGKGYGDYYHGMEGPEVVDAAQSKAYQDLAQRGSASNDADLYNGINAYGIGGQSLQGALDAYYNAKHGASHGADVAQFTNSLATNPLSGRKLAEDQVSQGMLSPIYGQGGIFGQTAQQAQDLANRGYSLQPEDYEAYGQASNNMARQFANSDKGLQRALASRGLAAGGGGQAISNYAGQYGNKMEQLAGLQQNMAQQRMQMNMQRLGQTRDFLSTLSKQGDEAVQNTRGANLAGVQVDNAQQENAAKAAIQRASDLNSANNANYLAKTQDAQSAISSKAGAKKNSGNDFLERGIDQGIQGGASKGIGGMVGGILG